ncbi:MAG: hypothetical protein QGI52_03410 [Alphaproteobacteria bacterium]|nr:hypothetical protein [Alphaproteobacteria bacterium]
MIGPKHPISGPLCQMLIRGSRQRGCGDKQDGERRRYSQAPWRSDEVGEARERKGHGGGVLNS